MARRCVTRHVNAEKAAEPEARVGVVMTEGKGRRAAISSHIAHLESRGDVEAVVIMELEFGTLSHSKAHVNPDVKRFDDAVTNDGVRRYSGL